MEVKTNMNVPMTQIISENLGIILNIFSDCNSIITGNRGETL
jgi:hypothetical protein